MKIWKCKCGTVVTVAEGHTPKNIACPCCDTVMVACEEYLVHELSPGQFFVYSTKFDAYLMRDGENYTKMVEVAMVLKNKRVAELVCMQLSWEGI